MLLPDCEKLLHVISLQGRLKSAKFQEDFDELYPRIAGLGEEERYFVRFQTIRFLEALGHSEYDYQNRQLYVCPATLALQSRSGVWNAILTGARTPVMLEQLREFVARKKGQ